MRIPRKITPDPIIDAVTELRFESDLHPDAVFGVISNAVKEEFLKFDRLPILQIPEQVRSTDPNLKYSPLFQSLVDNYRLNIGPRVISLANVNPYLGWNDSFFPKIKSIVERLESTGVVKRFIRLGVRYIDFFQEEDIFDSLNLTISMDGKAFTALEKQFSTVQDKGDGIFARIQITNNAKVTKNKTQHLNGSIIDSDIFWEPSDGFGFTELTDVINRCHAVANSTFYSLLKQEFIDSRNPDYDDI